MPVCKPTPKISAEAYLVNENARLESTKQEFVNGQVYIKTDVSRNHDMIAMNLAGLLFIQLRGSRCRVSQGLKLRIQTLHEDYIYYPDLQVSCDRELNNYYNTAPCLVCEILSSETARIDRSEKFAAYRLLPTLQEYVLCSQDSPIVEVYRREDNWDVAYYMAGDSFELNSVKATLQVNDLYEFIIDEPNEV
ncbi:MAG: Uma2 family endonuclease [Thiothrix sp.]|nr:MAG: Uma2 family endonuclease [Thiothrix sp.]